MVERTTATALDEFAGYLRKIEVVEGVNGKQFELKIEPDDKTVFKNSKTGFFHEWLRITAKTTDTTVPAGSVLDMYLKEVESVFKESKKEDNVVKALSMMLDKKVLWKKKVLGKSYAGHEAVEHWIPAQKL